MKSYDIPTVLEVINRGQEQKELTNLDLWGEEDKPTQEELEKEGQLRIQWDS